MRTRGPLLSSSTSSVANLTSVLHSSKANAGFPGDMESRVASLQIWASSSYKITQKLVQSLNHIQRTFGIQPTKVTIPEPPNLSARKPPAEQSSSESQQSNSVLSSSIQTNKEQTKKRQHSQTKTSLHLTSAQASLSDHAFRQIGNSQHRLSDSLCSPLQDLTYIRSSGDLKSKIFHGHKASMAGTSVSSYDAEECQEKSPSISSIYHPSTSKLVATAKLISSGKQKTSGARNKSQSRNKHPDPQNNSIGIKSIDSQISGNSAPTNIIRSKSKSSLSGANGSTTANFLNSDIEGNIYDSSADQVITSMIPSARCKSGKATRQISPNSVKNLDQEEMDPKKGRKSGNNSVILQLEKTPLKSYEPKLKGENSVRSPLADKNSATGKRQNKIRKKSMTEKKITSKIEKENEKEFAKKVLQFDAAEVLSHRGSFEKRIEQTLKEEDRMSSRTPSPERLELESYPRADTEEFLGVERMVSRGEPKDDQLTFKINNITPEIMGVGSQITLGNFNGDQDIRVKSRVVSRENTEISPPPAPRGQKSNQTKFGKEKAQTLYLKSSINSYNAFQFEREKKGPTIPDLDFEMTHTPCAGFSKNKKIELHTPNNRAPVHSASSNRKSAGCKKDRSISKHQKKERSPSPFKVKDSVTRAKRCKSTQKRRDKKMPKLSPLAKKFLDFPYTVQDTIGGFLGQQIPQFIYCQRILAKKYIASKKEEYSLQMSMITEQIDDLKQKQIVAKGGIPRFLMTPETREEYFSSQFKKQLPLLVGMCSRNALSKADITVLRLFFTFMGKRTPEKQITFCKQAYKYLLEMKTSLHHSLNPENSFDISEQNQQRVSSLLIQADAKDLVQPADSNFKVFTVLKTAIVEALNFAPSLETERSVQELMEEREGIQDIYDYFKNIKKSLSSILNLIK